MNPESGVRNQGSEISAVRGRALDPEAFERQAVALGQVLLELGAKVEAPVTHHFLPGIYMREITMPAGALIIGHLHRTEHLNFICAGRARVIMNGECTDVGAGDWIRSKAGVRKVLYIRETCRWQTIHANPDELRDIAALEAAIVDHDAVEKIYPEELARFRAHFRTQLAAERKHAP